MKNVNKVMRWIALAMVVLGFGTGCATSRSKSTLNTVVVEKNDTLNKIAQRYDTNWRDIAELNREQLSNGLREGQRLTIPVGPKANLQSHEAVEAEDVVAAEMADDQGEDDEANFIPKRKGGLLYGSESEEPSNLMFPVEGGISSHFGKRGRKNHKGIDIAANVGTPIVAAGDGEVIFSGRRRGYGSTIVVDHGRYMTLYAHASKLIARTGDKVSQGDFIAKVGRTGNARGAHLHFELRDSKNNPIDPEPYLVHKTIAQARKDSKSRFASGRMAKNGAKKVTMRSSKKRGLFYAKD
jgi:murein DD-endopeptidase MepM/ murein hydrolase activator NlpD